MLSLRYKDFKKIYSLIPTRHEQDSIVAFLDERLADIDRYIAKKQKLIELLNERKMAIVNKVITKGIYPDSEMKDSGIEWYPEIPINWDLKKLRFVAKINPSKSEYNFKNDPNQYVVFLPMENISDDGQINTSIRLPLSEVWSGFTYFREGDIVIAKITPCFENGKGAYLKNLPKKVGFGTTELITLRPNDEILPEYLYLLTYSDLFRRLGKEYMKGTAGQKRVTLEYVKDFRIPLPSKDEQKKILEVYENLDEDIRNVKLSIYKEINVILEIRDTLITNIVTGDIDIKK